jgi:hypothetical protein
VVAAARPLFWPAARSYSTPFRARLSPIVILKLICDSELARELRGVLGKILAIDFQKQRNLLTEGRSNRSNKIQPFGVHLDSSWVFC